MLQKIVIKLTVCWDATLCNYTDVSVKPVASSFGIDNFGSTFHHNVSIHLTNHVASHSSSPSFQIHRPYTLIPHRKRRTGTEFLCIISFNLRGLNELIARNWGILNIKTHSILHIFHAIGNRQIIFIYYNLFLYSCINIFIWNNLEQTNLETCIYRNAPYIFWLASLQRC
jgi:hypothetical protein